MLNNRAVSFVLFIICLVILAACTMFWLFGVPYMLLDIASFDVPPWGLP